MKKSSTILIFLLTLIGSVLGSCSNQDPITEQPDHQELEKPEQFDSMSQLIECDSIYPDKKIKVEYLEHEFEDNELDAILRITKNGRVMINDSLSSSVFAIEFKDFNGDGIKDIMAQNSSDVRSNWTWYLYLASENQETFKRIKGFEQIKNPIYDDKHDLIINLVMSGNDWTSFYQIQGDSAHDFGYVVYQGFNSDKQEYYAYDKDYESTLKKVLNSKEYH